MWEWMSPAATGAPGKRPTSKEATAAKVKRERRCLTSSSPGFRDARDHSPALGYARIRRSVHARDSADRRPAGLGELSAMAGGRDDDRCAGDIGDPPADVGAEEIHREPARLRIVEMTVDAELVRRELGRVRPGRPCHICGPCDLYRRESAMAGRLRVPALKPDRDPGVPDVFERA